MKRKEFKVIAIILIMFLLVPVMASAHSGRTDSHGGHRDNKNASGLGSYHYHCGGYPPHLHSNGVCPYKTTTSTPTKTTTSTTSTSTAAKSSPAISSKTTIAKPSFPVYVNGKNLNITASNYYPVVINNVTYLPLSSDIISALNLSGGWRNQNEGIVLNSNKDYVYYPQVSETSEELNFYRDTTYIVDLTTDTYHTYDCSLYEEENVSVLSKDFIEALQDEGVELHACLYCIYLKNW